MRRHAPAGGRGKLTLRQRLEAQLRKRKVELELIEKASGKYSLGAHVIRSIVLELEELLK